VFCTTLEEWGGRDEEASKLERSKATKITYMK